MKNVALLKEKYLEGTKIRLIHMDDPQAVPAGTIGEIRKVDDAGTIHIVWQTGSTLGLIEGIDSFEVI